MHIQVFKPERSTPVLLQTDEVIVWNIGQGQWVSIVTQDKCLHLDMGGEHVNWLPILNSCGEKQNLAYFSHWDLDHISFARPALRKFKYFCVAARPGGPVTSDRKLEMLSAIPNCEQQANDDFEEVKTTGLRTNLRRKLSSNDYSRVFTFNSWLLSQGDSTRTQEKFWVKNLKQPIKIKILILGHHGSRTSSSEELIANLTELKMGISSARKSRYGHPHIEVLQRLKKHGVAALLTEDWGNIHFEIPNQENKAHSLN